MNGEWELKRDFFFTPNLLPNNLTWMLGAIHWLILLDISSLRSCSCCFRSTSKNNLLYGERYCRKKKRLWSPFFELPCLIHFNWFNINVLILSVFCLVRLGCWQREAGSKAASLTWLQFAALMYSLNVLLL